MNCAHRFDYVGLADDEGFVDVMVFTSEDTKSSSAIDKVISKMTKKDASRLVDEVRQGEKKQFSKVLNGFAARLSVDSIDAIVSAYPSVSIYPDITVEAFVNYDIRQVGADVMWTRTDSHGASVTGTGIVVAIIDTGIDYNHPDLGGGFGPSYKVIGGFDFVNNDSDPMDDNGHGTHVAGIVGADGVTFKGVAPGARLLAYKALGSDGYGKGSDVLAAIERAVDPNGDGDSSDHVDVISMSLGGPGDEDDPLSLAVDAAVDAGVVVVAAAGNEGPTMGTVGSPGSAVKAITVGAVDGSGDLADFSSRGTSSIHGIKPEISAPGVLITSTVPTDASVPLGSTTGYRMLSGTSMAAPHVSGGAALLIQLHPDWTPAKVKSAIVSGSIDNPEPVWYSGAGDLWIPGAADSDLFVSNPVPLYDFSSGSSIAMTLSNSGAGVTLGSSSTDWHIMKYNGSKVAATWLNGSTVAPSSISVSAGSSGTITLSVGTLPSDAPEGYYEGEMVLTNGARELRVPFGYVVLSRLEVHVLDMAGIEVVDEYGFVSVYSVPDGDVAMTVSSDRGTSPPASFLLPSGVYSVHAAGHSMIYRYDDPYILSDEVTLARMDSMELHLSMSTARQFTVDLSTEGGQPIYVKDYRVYVEDEGANNHTTDLKGTDYSIGAEDMQVLPSAMTIYVSDTDANVGVSLVGYSYTPAMWEFMYRNRLYWHQFTGRSSSNFLIESTCDLQYFIAWEFAGIDSSTGTSLALVPGQYSVIDTKYDIPGALRTYTGNWGTTLSPAGLITLFVREDSDAPINQFFAGMNRRTIVQGVFSELYMPGDIYDETMERSFYDIDYSHYILALASAGIYLPDRDFITALPASTSNERFGMGPFYPGLWTSNTNSTMVLHQPLLRDQSGAKVIEKYFPTMKIYRDGSLQSSGEVQEFMARPDAFRVLSISPGLYRLEFSAPASPQICTAAQIVLSFRVPGTDIDPPQIAGLEMSQKFQPGQSLPVEISVTDGSSVGTVELSWRSTDTGSWQSATVSNLGSGRYGTSIQTTISDERINLRMKVSDSSGNYIEYTTTNASLKEVPVLLSLGASVHDIEYRSADVVVTLTGHLTDAYGAPLNPGYAVPLELMLDGVKVGMILDEYVTTTGWSHNGSIRFDWHVNPTKLFSSSSQTANIMVTFDLGVYQVASASFTLQAVPSTNSLPTITLQSPANGSLFASGQVVDLDITDDGSFTASATLDGASVPSFASPWQLPTSTWSDGQHVLSVTASDTQGGVSQTSYTFTVDAIAPSVSITYPTSGARIPVNSVLTATVSDARLVSVTRSIDGSPAATLSAPYSIDMTGWVTGPHTVTITATDSVSHQTSRTVSFEIAAGNVVLQLLTPANGSCVHSGTPIGFIATGNGTMTYKWSESGFWNDIGTQTIIPTTGWSQGIHTVIINATSSEGGSDQIVLVLMIDDAGPVIQLQSPLNGSFVTKTDVVRIHIQEFNIQTVSWTLWGAVSVNTGTDIVIPLSASPSDGAFYLNINATDKAGNSCSAQYRFLMDSAAPTVQVTNLVTESAILPGFVINVSAVDSFLSSVTCSLDNGAPYTLPHPFRVSTSSLQTGWHALKLAAYDSSGKNTTYDIRFYIDDAAPVASMSSGQEFTSGDDFEITVNVTDEFMVAGVTMFYELKDGTFASVVMTLDGYDYIASIPSADLREGMAIYVVATDSVGNLYETTHVELHASSSGLQGDIIPSDWALFGVPIYMVLIFCAMTVCSVLAIALVRRRGAAKRARARLAASSRIETVAARASPPVAAAPTVVAAAPSAPKKEMDIPSTAIRRAAYDPMPVAAAASQELKPALIDAIPTVVLKSPEPTEEAEPEIDYGRLIEEELIIPSMKNSVFRETIRDVNAEIEMRLDELRALCEEKPKKTLG
jgi:subtilisin family serine protease